MRALELHAGRRPRRDDRGEEGADEAFGYLVVTAPATDPCSGVADGGVGDGGACTNPWTPAWSQGSGDQPAFRIPRGTRVVVHATSSLVQTAQTVPFAYLVDTQKPPAFCRLQVTWPFAVVPPRVGADATDTTRSV